jgi:hypothetical protein
MKELYLGLALTALILIILSISFEVSTTGNIFSNINQRTQNNNSNSYVYEDSTLNHNSLNNTFPERISNASNLNNIFLKKYYNRKNYNPKNNFYV